MRQKFLYTAMALVVTLLQFASCADAKSKNDSAKTNAEAESTNVNTQNKEHMKDKKILVAFYSRAGENYSVGNVKVGNTQVLAEMIAEETGADLFHIEPVKEYPADYTECTEVAKKEKDSNARPDIKGDIKVEDYDVIFIGYPNWWSDAPMPVYTFIDKHDWQGKTVIPFCTHEGSGLSNATEIQAACKGAKVLKGLGMYGHTAQNERDAAKKSMQKWLKDLGF